MDLKDYVYKFYFLKIFDVDFLIFDFNFYSMRWKSLRDLIIFVFSFDVYIEDLLEFFRSKNVMF